MFLLSSRRRITPIIKVEIEVNLIIYPRYVMTHSSGDLWRTHQWDISFNFNGKHQRECFKVFASSFRAIWTYFSLAQCIFENVPFFHCFTPWSYSDLFCHFVDPSRPPTSHLRKISISRQCPRATFASYPCPAIVTLCEERLQGYSWIGYLAAQPMIFL